MTDPSSRREFLGKASAAAGIAAGAASTARAEADAEEKNLPVFQPESVWLFATLSSGSGAAPCLGCGPEQLCQQALHIIIIVEN